MTHLDRMVFDLEFCYIQTLKLSFIVYYDKCHQSLYYIVGYYYTSYILSVTVTSSVLRDVYKFEFSITTNTFTL